MTQLEKLKEILELIRSDNIEEFLVADKLLIECIDYEEKHENIGKPNIYFKYLDQSPV